MGTILLSQLVQEARGATLDLGETPRHDDPRYLGLGNAGQRQMAIYKPDVSVANEAVQLAAGTKQQIPSGGTVFIKLTRNMGTDGQTPGRTIAFESDMERFSRRNPYWHAADTSSEVRFYLFDPKDPRRFYTYPPQPQSSTGWAEMIYGTPPADIAAIGDPISVDDIYANALLDYMLYRIFKIEATINPYAPAKSTDHWNMFVTALGRMDLVKQTNSPKNSEEPANARQVR
jgi:hypothetical protein